MNKSNLKDFSNHIAGSAAVIALLSIPSCAYAANQNADTDDTSTELKEIIVTAEHRSADIQKTAVSVSVKNGEDLKRQGRFTLQDILQDIPSVIGGAAQDTVGGKSDNAGISIAIRGISSNKLGKGSIVSTVPGIAVYVDGVYEGVGGGYDIDRVEVLRGPQGTLYGRSATAGVVALHTADPDLIDLGADVSLETGSYGLAHASGALNIPLGEKAALRVSGNYYERDGYYSKEGGAFSNSAARAKLLLKPTDTLSVLLGAQFEDNTYNTGGILNYVSGSSQSVPVGPGKTNLQQYWAQVDWDIGPATLTYIPAWRTFTQNATLISNFGSLVLSQPDVTPHDVFLTQEIRLTSAEHSKLKWQTGAFFYDNKLNSNTSLSFISPFQALSTRAVNERHTQNIGVFAEATYPLTDAWRLTGGVRYDHTYVQNNESYTKNTCGSPYPLPETDPGYTPACLSVLNLNGADATRKFNNVTYKARVEHDLARDSLAYAMVSTGFLPGDVQIGTGVSGSPTIMGFDSATTTAFEVGTKNRFLDRRLQVNASAFYYKTYFQTSGINTSGNSSTQRFALFLVPERSYGGELEVSYRPTHADQIDLSYSYVNAYTVDGDTTYALNVPNPYSYYVKHTKIDNIVPHTVNLAYTHTFDLFDGSTLVLRGAARYYSAHSVSSTTYTYDFDQAAVIPYVHLGDQVIGDLNATWTTSDKRFSITGYVRNVTNNRYKTNVLLASPLTSTTYTPYDPLTIGGVVSFNL